jgi:VIT1/CCC1 family predicted Fe2+/Mn2+ transporter
MWVAVTIAARLLFGVGVYKARTMVGHPVESGLEMALICTLSTLLGYAVGTLLSYPRLPD